MGLDPSPNKLLLNFLLLLGGRLSSEVVGEGDLRWTVRRILFIILITKLMGSRVTVQVGRSAWVCALVFLGSKCKLSIYANGSNFEDVLGWC